jgi:hypothetical protein
MTYCEQTDHNEFALHLNSTELNEVLQGLQNRESKEAEKLKRIIQSEKLIGEKRIFLKNREIELCKECGGSGKLRIYVNGTHEYDYEPCSKCDGKSGRVKITTTTYQPLNKLWQEHFTR